MIVITHCAAALAALLLALPAWADGSALDIDLPAQSLASALHQVAERHKLQIIFSPGDVDGIATSTLRGRYTAVEAVARLIEGYGLGYSYNGIDTLVVRHRKEIPRSGRVRPENPTRLASAQSPKTSADVSTNNRGEAGRKDADFDIDEVVVTGSYIRRSHQVDTASALTVISADELSAQGAVTTADLVKNLNINSAAQFQVDSLGQNLTSGTASINLRGLGLGSTLVMVNGRRQTLSAVATGEGSSFVDVNSLMPLILVDRVEVLKDGAAATYGSDAVAGVVNVVPRLRYQGFQLQGNIAHVDKSRAADREVAGLWGSNAGASRWVAAFSLLERTPLQTPERSWALAGSYDYPLWAGVSSFGRPGNYLVPDQGLRADPDCGSVVGSFLINNTCMLDYSPYFDLSPKENRQQFYSVLTHLGAGVKSTLEFGYTRSRTTTIASPSFPVLTYVPLIPRDHPDNPYGQPVSWLGRIAGAPEGPSVAHFGYDTLRLAGALAGTLLSGWIWDLDSAYSRQDARYDRPDTMKSRLTLALNGFGGSDCNPATESAGRGSCRYFNPFGTAYTGRGTTNPASLLAWMTATTGLTATSSLLSSNLVFSGDLFAFSTVPVAAAVGFHHRYERLHHDWSEAFNANDLSNLGGGNDFDVKRNVRGIFAEIKLPLAQGLEAQVSTRYENYGHGIDSLDPKLSLLWRPLSFLSLRGAVSTAFRAPSLLQSQGVQSSNSFVNDRLTGASLYANVQTRGMKTLKPETADVLSMGATWTPLSQTELSLDYWQFKYRDLIVKENAQALVDVGSARVLRDPVSQGITLIQAKFVNASAVYTTGLDLDMRYRISAALGTFSLGLQWTEVLRYALRATPEGPMVDGLGSLNATNFAGPIPRQRGTFSFSWNRGNQNFNAYWRYIGPYRNDRSGSFMTERNIGAWKTLDVQYRIDFRDVLPSSGTTSFTLGATNLTNRPPPFAQLLLAYDPRTADPRGRILYLELRHFLP